MRIPTKKDLIRLGFALLAGFAGAASSRPAEAGPVAFVAGSGNEFGTLDLGTGAFNSIGTFDLPLVTLPNGYTLIDTIVAMGFGADGKLYGLDAQPDAHLFQINLTSGGLTDLGALGRSAFAGTSDAAGQFYGLTQDANASLFSLDPPSPAATTVGPTGIASSGLAAVTADGSHLYASTYSGGSTYTLTSIDTSTGVATTLGDTGFSPFSGLFVGGTLYGFDGINDAILTFNLTTGAGTQVGTYDLGNGDSIDAAAIQPAAVPEPSSLALCGLAGVMGVGVALRRRKRAC